LQKVLKTLSQPIAVQWHTSVIPATKGSINKMLVVQAGLGIKQDPISKITSAKSLAQVVECLPSKLKAQYHQKKRKEGREGGKRNQLLHFASTPLMPTKQGSFA
jgi:hypothetical protein